MPCLAFSGLCLMPLASLCAADSKAVDAQELNPEAVLAIARTVGDWQLAHPSQLKEHEPTAWTQGALYTGIMALQEITGDKTYLDAMMEMGRKTEWKPGPRVFFADDHTVCQTYLELYQIQKDLKIIEPTRNQFDYILAHPKTRDLVWPKPGTGQSEFENWSDRWAWCDALFMAPAAWAGLFAATGDRRYLDFMDREWWTTTDYLYDAQEGLFYRDSRFFSQKAPGGQKIFWSRGNGWVYAGITRVLNHLPSDYPSRPRYLQLYREMTAAVLKARQPDGLWRPSLMDPEQIPVGETSGSGFFCYGLAWGINQGILDPATYWPLAAKSWQALVAKVHPDGKLGYVQPIGGAPDKVTADSTEVYGTGAFLLAAREIYHYLKAHPDQAAAVPASTNLSAETLRKLRDVVVRDWLNAPAHTTNWLRDSADAAAPVYPSNNGLSNTRLVRELMSAQRADGSWPEVDYQSTPRQSWPALLHFEGHLHELVLAYAVSGSPLYHDEALKKNIVQGIHYWLKNDYQNPNWWYQYIGLPAYYLGPVLLVMRGELDAGELDKGREILSRCDLKRHDKWRTGGNLIFDCRAALYSGLLADDAELLGRMFRRMIYGECHFTPPTGSGIKDDFSEWEHGNLLFNHGYGALLIGEASRLLWYGHEAGIPADPVALDFLTRFLLEGSSWMARGEFLDYSAMGRSITTPTPVPGSDASAQKKLALAKSATPTSDMNYLALGARYLMRLGVAQSNELSVLSERVFGGAPALAGNRMFPVSDFMTHSRTNFYSSVRMYSSRTLNTEVCNGQNRLGHHLGEGTTYFICRGDEYRNIFPVWDWTKVPGTTVNRTSLDDTTVDELVDSGWFPSTDPEVEGFGRGRLRVSRFGRTDFVGGVSDGLNGVACMNLKVLSLQARKAWFYLGDQIVCLGAGITDPNRGSVATTINQCRLKGPVRYLDANGPEKTLHTGTYPLAGARMVYHDDIAYLFPSPQPVHCSDQTQEGDWHRVDVNQSQDPVQMDVFSLWLEHGERPESATYCYGVIPGVDFERAREILSQNTVSVLSNTALLQAVQDKNGGTVGAVFYQPGMLEIPARHKILVSDACVLMISETTKKLSVAAPDGAKKTVNINLDGRMLFVRVAGGKTTSVTF